MTAKQQRLAGGQADARYGRLEVARRGELADTKHRRLTSLANLIK